MKQTAQQIDDQELLEIEAIEAYSNRYQEYSGLLHVYWSNETYWTLAKGMMVLSSHTDIESAKQAYTNYRIGVNK